MPDPADHLLAEDHLASLNDEFYASPSPATYFRGRLAGLLLVVDGGESVADLIRSGLSIGDFSFRAEVAEESDEQNAELMQYAAVEAENLFHNAAECLLRMLLAHRDKPACPWLELARMRSDRAFRRRIETEILRGGDAWREAVCDLMFGGSAPGRRLGPADNDDWNATVDSTIGLIGRIASEFLSDSVLFNSTKHGLGIAPGLRMVAWGDENGEPLTLGDGMAIAFIEQDGKPKRWRQTARWIRTDVTLALTGLLLQTLDTVWELAKARYTGADGATVTYLRPGEWEAIAEAIRPKHPGRSFSMDLPYYRSDPDTPSAPD